MTFRSANQWAVTQLSNQSPEYSAKKLWRRNHSFNIILACLYGLFLYFTGYTGLVWSLNIFAFTFFVYRFVLTILGLRGDKDQSNMLSVDDPTLPRYAVLLPMRNEPTDVVQDLITNIDNLNYPKDKLDVIMLVDEDDDYLQEIDSMEKPDHFRVMSAYAEAPFTKPKVCNVGLMQTNAEYVTIYDAEDKPDPDAKLGLAMLERRGFLDERVHRARGRSLAGRQILVRAGLRGWWLWQLALMPCALTPSATMRGAARGVGRAAVRASGLRLRCPLAEGAQRSSSRSGRVLRHRSCSHA